MRTSYPVTERIFAARAGFEPDIERTGGVSVLRRKQFRIQRLGYAQKGLLCEPHGS